MKIYLMRHSAPELPPELLSRPGKEGVYLGITDLPLSEGGLELARNSTGNVDGLGITKIYSSPLKRAYQTAEVMAEHLGGLPITVDVRCREINFGDWDGKLHSEIDPLNAEHIARRRKDPFNLGFPGSDETFGTLRIRAREMIDELRRDYPNDNILIVAHAGWIAAAICAYSALFTKCFMDRYLLRYCEAFDVLEGDVRKYIRAYNPQDES